MVTQQVYWVVSVTFIINIFLSWCPCTCYTSYLIFQSQILFSRPQLKLFLLNNVFLLVLPKMDLFAATSLLYGTLLTRPVQSVLLARSKKNWNKYINNIKRERTRFISLSSSVISSIHISSFFPSELSPASPNLAKNRTSSWMYWHH